MNNFFYCLKQGLKNLIRHPLFSAASVVTVGACIFIFCMFLAISRNIDSVLQQTEESIGVTVFFTEEAGETEKEQLKEKITAFPGVREVRYISAEEAWESFRKEYFGDREEEFSDAFREENPLEKSDSFEVFLSEIEQQEPLREMLQQEPAVREVNTEGGLVGFLKQTNHAVSVFSAAAAAVLFAVSVFLISNTVSVTAAFRRRENEIMRLIGATDFMISAPFIFEGILIGGLGLLLSLLSVRAIYLNVSESIAREVSSLTVGAGSSFTGLLPFSALLPDMLTAGAVLGIGTGFIVSLLTIRKHLRK